MTKNHLDFDFEICKSPKNGKVFTYSEHRSLYICLKDLYSNLLKDKPFAITTNTTTLVVRWMKS